MKHDEMIRTAAADPSWRSRLLAGLNGYPNPAACWVWIRARDPRGYGRMALPRHVGQTASGSSILVGVHRAMWLVRVGPIPEGMVVDHDGPAGCHNRSCANPDHLTLSTVRENTIENGTGPSAQRSRQSHCLRGHELSEANNLAAYSRIGRRGCAVCAKDRRAERAALVTAARRKLGITSAEYMEQYGTSARRARSILDEQWPEVDRQRAVRLLTTATSLRMEVLG